ncbi:hypothetical protein EIK77_002367 [Talaromyces pinophilus]|nr:hypothetical protein EIK77_002367 [Talaromyces pinophilus]
MEEWQCVISDPAVPISAPTPQSLPTCDDQVSDSNMSGRKYPDVREAWMPDRSGNVLASTMVASGTPPRLCLACDSCRRSRKKCSGDQPCDRCHRLKRSCAYKRGRVYEIQQKVSVTEDAVNQTIPRFSDDQWNYIFMKSEPGNDLDFSPAEAPMVNTVNAQEAFGPSPLEPNMENVDLHDENLCRLGTLDQNASKWKSSAFQSQRYKMSY